MSRLLRVGEDRDFVLVKMARSANSISIVIRS
jgi:hypothetical protein